MRDSHIEDDDALAPAKGIVLSTRLGITAWLILFALGLLAYDLWRWL